MRITPENIVKAINNLPRNQWFDYIGEHSKGKIQVVSAQLPEGPVVIKRYDPSRKQTVISAKEANISGNMLWRVANAIQPGVPVNIDRVLGASYNTRSALETLLAHTPEFYWCLPGRIELVDSTSQIKRGHKHLVWIPEKPHRNGVAEKYETDVTISEIPTASAVYEAIALPDTPVDNGMDIEAKRRHLQIQIALVIIGRHFGFRTWIARNDQGLTYRDKKVGELEGVIHRLEDEKMLQAYPDAVHAALLIDGIWFEGDRFMPAVIEVEHSTGVTSGLSRMKNFQDRIPPFPTRWIIVAPDEDRDKVYREANKPQFHSLKAMYMPYSAVDELYSLLQRRGVTPDMVNDKFLNCYLESCIS